MAGHHMVTLNGHVFSVRSGQILLDGALTGGIDMPHDCRAGRCGSCRTLVRRGITLGGATPQRGAILACQARVFSDLELMLEDLPPVDSVRATLCAVAPLTNDVVELKIALSAPLTILPGQYCHFTFDGFPARAFSPTAPLDGRRSDNCLHLQIKRVRNGRISTNLGLKIRKGHKLTIEGPFGHGFLRPGLANRLVLIAGGTGFAPIWSVADAALRENPARSIHMVVGTRKLASFYMGPALELVEQFPNVEVVATTEERQSAFHRVRFGIPLDFIPALNSSDIVYAAGSPLTVESAGRLAEDKGATIYCDPFEASCSAQDDWLTRAMTWLRTG